MWHWMPRENEAALQSLTDSFNSSQNDVKVTLVNQIDWEATFQKYKSGLGTGDLPDVVQLQESDQQQMIDTQTVLPAGVCAKADKYSFSDFLPRVISYFTVQGTQYAMPFNTSGSVLFYNKKAFTAAGLDPRRAADDPRRACAPRPRSSRPTGSRRRSGLKTDPIFIEQWAAMANRLFVEQRQRSPVARDRGRVRRPDGPPDLHLDGRHGGRRPRHAPTPTSAPASSTTCSASAAARTRWRSTPAPPSAPSRRCSAPGNDPNIDLGVAPMPGLRASNAGWCVQPGWRAVHGEQVGAREAGGGVEVPEVPGRARERDRVGDRDRLHPDPGVVGGEHRDAGLLGAEPGVQGRLRPVARRPGHRRHRGFGHRQQQGRARRAA